MNLEEIKKLFQRNQNERRNVFHSTSFNRNEEIFSTLLRAKNINELSVLQFAAVKGNENTFNDLVNILKKVFTNEEIKEMFFEVNKVGNNSLHVACSENNNITIKSFIIHVSEILNFEETKKLSNKEDFNKKTFFILLAATKMKK